MKSELNFWDSFGVGLIFTTIIWLIKLIETLLGFSFALLGLYPQRWEGLLGIITAPFLHGDFAHLLSNTFPVILLSGLLFQIYPKVSWRLIRWLFLATGFWTWCFAREAYHIGASGLIYGLAAFLFFAGVFRKNRPEAAVSLVIILLYSGLLWGLIPKDVNVSWESHLSGFIAGASFAFFSRRWDITANSNDSFLQNTEEIHENQVKIISLKYRKKLEDTPKSFKTNV